MKAIKFIIIALFLTASLNAQDTLYIYRSGAVVYKSIVAEVDSINFYNPYAGNAVFKIQDGTTWTVGNPILSNVQGAVVNIYTDQTSITNNTPEYTASSDANGIAKFNNLPSRSYFLIVKKGNLSNIIDGYTIAGIFQNSNDISSWPRQSGAVIGGYKFVDFNHDGVISSQDTGNYNIFIENNQTVTDTIIIGNPTGNLIFTQAAQDSMFAKIYSTLGLTGNLQPAGNPDIVGINEDLIDFTRGVWNLNELTTDEAICAWGDSYIPGLNFNQWSSTNDLIKGIFERLYYNITLCNNFIILSSSKTDDASLKQRAEARFMRALNYYYLLDLFGYVPFTDGMPYTGSLQINRADLFTYIENELIACEPNMYEAILAPYGRADKVANWLLRSRLYLNAEVYTGTARWTDAAVYAKKVMDSGYTLCATYKHLFMADNDNSGNVNTARQEIILPIYANGVKAKSWGSSLFLIASTHSTGMAAWGSTAGWGGNRARATLIKKFFPTGTASFTNEADLTTATLASLKDNRALFDKKSVSVSLSISTPMNFNEGYQVIKFSNIRADGAATSDTQFSDMDVPLFRVAEAYLTYAEALTRGASPVSGFTALSAMNALRTRAGATSFTALTLQNIIDEKAREFFFEGQRRTDLIRFGQYGGTNVTYTWDWKGGTATGINFGTYLNVFPIPQAELIVNSNLKQNPGY